MNYVSEILFDCFGTCKLGEPSQFNIPESHLEVFLCNTKGTNLCPSNVYLSMTLYYISLLAEI